MMDEVVHFMTSPAASLAVEITEWAERMLAREVDSLTASGSGILKKSRPVRKEEQGGLSAVVCRNFSFREKYSPLDHDHDLSHQNYHHGLLLS